jgi:hypothetical protein
MGPYEHLDYVKSGKCLDSQSNYPILMKISYRGPNKELWIYNNNKNSVPCVVERIIPTELSPLVSDASANLLLIECHVVSVTDHYGRILGFLDLNHYFS